MSSELSTQKITENQVCRHLAKAKYSDLQSSELAYCAVDLGYSEGQYFKKILGREQSSKVTARSISLGAAPQQNSPHRSTFLDWDVRDCELESSTRVTSNALQLQLVLAKPFSLESSAAPSRLRELTILSPRNAWWTLAYRGFELVFSTIAVIERLLAPSQRIANLLLSPFSEVGFEVSRTDLDLHLRFLTANPFLGTATRAGKRVGVLSSSETMCLGYWLGSAEYEAKLAQIANSIEPGQELLLPRLPELLTTTLQGVRVGRTIFVQNFGNNGSSRWPVTWRNLQFSFVGGRVCVSNFAAPDMVLLNERAFVREKTKDRSRANL